MFSAASSDSDESDGGEVLPLAPTSGAVTHPRCYMIDSSPFPLVAPCRSPKLVITPGTRCTWPSQARHRCRSHLFWEGPLLYTGIINLSFRAFPLFPFVLDLPLFVPEFSPLLWPFHHFRHRTSYILAVYTPIIVHFTCISPHFGHRTPLLPLSSMYPPSRF